jgi:CBS domain-containing protein
MTIKIADIMQESVITTTPDVSLGEVRRVMSEAKISSVPVVDSGNEVVGIVTTSDLAKGLDDDTPIRDLLGGHVYTVPAYNPVHIAARVMRNHHIHHVVVTHEQEVVGIVSSFDLLKLVEDHRFVMKSPSTPSKHDKGRQ